MTSVRARSYTVPTDGRESDGTLEWDSTTIVVVEVAAGGHRGLGYTYAHQAVATLVNDKLAGVLEGRDPLAVGACWDAMAGALRNVGWPGVGAEALSAVDIALWDLKARILEL
ncbi:MAG TPA: hypothetical protein VFH45_03280, partial [Acidimicrobiales bacterium]|nr:hypothetical protein [Acidimicrobiales bacterium]